MNLSFVFCRASWRQYPPPKLRFSHGPAVLKNMEEAGAAYREALWLRSLYCVEKHEPTDL